MDGLIINVVININNSFYFHKYIVLWGIKVRLQKNVKNEAVVGVLKMFNIAWTVFLGQYVQKLDLEAALDVLKTFGKECPNVVLRQSWLSLEL